MLQSLEIEVGGRKLSIETGEMAKQADGSAVVRYGDTALLATVVASKSSKEGVDFLPLTCDYREKFYAAGRIPGGFFRREGKQGEKEVLISRMMDRPLRPLFPKGVTREIQLMCSTLSFEADCDTEALAITAGSIAVCLSSIPFDGPVAGVKVGKIGDEYIINPSVEQKENSTLNLLMAGTKDSIVMVEAGAQEISEDEMVNGLIRGHEEIKKIVALQEELVGLKGKEKFAFTVPEKVEGPVIEKVRSEYLGKIQEAVLIKQKLERQAAKETLLNEIKEKHGGEEGENVGEIASLFEEIEKETVRKSILEKGVRGDGRGPAEIRPISIRLGMYKRTHGSALFTRGETQALVFTTLGTAMDAQKLDTIDGRSSKDFMLHYNFPSFCVGEVKPNFGPGRREIGHGSLAERAVKEVLPKGDDFPYSIRVVSEILESNGSSSMASVCGASLSLMDAGVPVEGAVAGIAMGLVMEGERTVIISDITGQEDHLGDMDFKVAGTQKGLTALQMDIKIKGVTKELMETALAQAKEGRLQIIDTMAKAIDTPRSEMSDYAPRMTTIKVDSSRVKDVIGPGGKMIRSIVEKTGVNIDIKDDGSVIIASYDNDSCQQAIDLIESVTKDAEVGKVYTGTVKKIMDFGAFVEILPGKDGLVHISQLAEHRVTNVSDEVSEGDVIDVKVLEVDRQGKIRLSRKEVLKEA